MKKAKIKSQKSNARTYVLCFVWSCCFSPKKRKEVGVKVPKARADVSKSTPGMLYGHREVAWYVLEEHGVGGEEEEEDAADDGDLLF